MNQIINWISSQPWYIESFIFYGSIILIIFFFIGIQKSEEKGLRKLGSSLSFIKDGVIEIFKIIFVFTREAVQTITKILKELLVDKTLYQTLLLALVIGIFVKILL